MSSPVAQYTPPEDDPIEKITSLALEGKKALILGIANVSPWSIFFLAQRLTLAFP